MYTTLGAPSGARGGSNGDQSSSESRMSTLTVPLNCWPTRELFSFEPRFVFIESLEQYPYFTWSPRPLARARTTIRSTSSSESDRRPVPVHVAAVLHLDHVVRN